MPFDLKAFLQGFRGKKVCFYPSCGSNLCGLLDLPCELFILSDYLPLLHCEGVSNIEPFREPRYISECKRFFSKVNFSLGGVSLYASMIRARVFEKDGKWFVLFFQDNNEALKQITLAGLKLSYFIGKNDGCREGGNYECVNEWHFLRKVLRIADDRMVYITDHLQRMPYYGRGWLENNLRLLARSPRLFNSFWESKPADLSDVDKRSIHAVGGWVFVRKRVLFRKDQNAMKSPYRFRRHFLMPNYSDETVEYLVFRHPRRRRSISFNRVCLTFEFDDILVAIGESDGLVLSEHCYDLLSKDNLLQNNLPKDKVYIVSNWAKETRNSKAFTERVLSIAYERGWGVVSVLPFGGGRHRGILEAACSWERSLPEMVRIFHIDPGDFNDIEEELTEI